MRSVGRLLEQTFERTGKRTVIREGEENDKIDDGRASEQAAGALADERAVVQAGWKANERAGELAGDQAGRRVDGRSGGLAGERACGWPSGWAGGWAGGWSCKWAGAEADELTGDGRLGGRRVRRCKVYNALLVDP